MNDKDFSRYCNTHEILTLLSPEKRVNVVYHKAPIVSMTMTARAFPFGFLDATRQIKTPQQGDRAAGAEFKGSDFTESLCWAGGLVEGLQLETGGLLPYSSGYGSGMPLLLQVSCGLLGCTAVPGFNAVVRTCLPRQGALDAGLLSPGCVSLLTMLRAEFPSIELLMCGESPFL